MAAENVPGIVQQVPEWVQYLAWFVVTVGGGLAARIAWVSGKTQTPEKEVQIAGSITDNRAIKSLVEAIQDTIERSEKMHRDKLKHETVQTELLESLGEDIRNLTMTLNKVFQKLGN